MTDVVEPDGFLRAWVIYDHPTDHPDHYVVRGQRIEPGAVVPDADPLAVVDTLDQARDRVPFGCTCLGRHPADDRKIVEVWI